MHKGTLSPEKYAAMEAAVGKAKVALTSMKAKSKKLKEEMAMMQEELDKQKNENIKLRERVALLESRLGAAPLNEGSKVEEDHEHSGSEIDSGTDDVDEDHEEIQYEYDDEENESENEDDEEAAMGVNARYGDAKTDEGIPEVETEKSGKNESMNESTIVEEKCNYLFGMEYSNESDDIRAVALAIGSCSPRRVVRGLFESMHKIPIAPPGPRIIRMKRIIALLKMMCSLSLRIEFHEFLFLVTGKSRKSQWKRAPAAMVPGILYVRELLACLREQVLSAWIARMNAEGQIGDNNNSLSYFSKTMLIGATEEHEYCNVKSMGPGDEITKDCSVDHLRCLLASGAASKSTSTNLNNREDLNQNMGTSSAENLVVDATIRTMSAIFVLSALSLMQTNEVNKYMETLLLLESTPRGRESLCNWPLLGAISALGLASSSTVFSSELPNFNSSLVSSGLHERLQAYVHLAGESTYNESTLLRLSVACTKQQMLPIAITKNDALDSQYYDIKVCMAHRRLGFLGTITAPRMISAKTFDSGDSSTLMSGKCFIEGGLEALYILHDREAGKYVMNFIAEGLLHKDRVMSEGTHSDNDTHPLLYLCKWLGPLPSLSPREDIPIREALVEAFRGAWDQALQIPSPREAIKKICIDSIDTLQQASTEFDRWRMLLHSFSQYEYDADSTSERSYSRAREIQVVSSLDSLGYGWRAASVSAINRGSEGKEKDPNQEDSIIGENDDEPDDKHIVGQQFEAQTTRSRALGKLLRRHVDIVRSQLRDAILRENRPPASLRAIALDASSDEDENDVEIPVPPIEQNQDHCLNKNRNVSSSVPATVKLATAGSLFARCMTCCTTSFDHVANAVHVINLATNSPTTRASKELIHLQALVATAIFEVLCVLISACAKACIVAVIDWHRKFLHNASEIISLLSIEGMKDYLKVVGNLLATAMTFLSEAPAPFSYIHVADTAAVLLSAHSVLAEIHHIHSKGTKKRLRSLSITPQHDKFTRQISGLLPCFVLNLARRPDRYMKAVKDTCDAGMLPLVLNAFDASAKYMKEESVNTDLRDEKGAEGDDQLAVFMQAFLNIASSDGQLPSPSIHECIPESYVSKTWDSTQNNYFDPTCVVNEITPMHPSERCCAASHLAAWLLIDRLRRGLTRREEGPYFNHESIVNCLTCSGLSVLDDLLKTCIHAQYMFNMCRAGGGWEPLPPHMGLDDWYLILEDDAVVAPEYREPVRFRRHLAQIIASLPPDWDILYLGHAASARGKGKALKGGIFYKPCYIWQLHGYILRGRAVEILLSLLPIRGPVDNFIASLVYDGSLQAYSLQRQLIIQEGNLQHRMSDSNIYHSGRKISGDNQGHGAPWKSMQK